MSWWGSLEIKSFCHSLAPLELVVGVSLMASSNSQTSSDEARLCLPRAVLFETELEVCVIELTQYQDEASEMLRVRSRTARVSCTTYVGSLQRITFNATRAGLRFDFRVLAWQLERRPWRSHSVIHPTARFPKSSVH